MEFRKFEDRVPSHQNAIDIFKGRWASNLDAICGGAIAGDALHFGPAPIVSFAARTLGRNGRFDGMSVLELGPLEGGKTYGLERLGANVLAMESNVEAYLKCLIVKEIARMKARFLCGSFIPYLETTTDRFDMVFASGVLYHMEDPISVIQSIARVTDKCFVYAAVHEPNRPVQLPHIPKTDPRFPDVELFTNDYRDSQRSGQFWGGIAPTSTWMTAKGMMQVFRASGLDKIEELPQPPTETNGVVCFSAMKQAHHAG